MKLNRFDRSRAQQQVLAANQTGSKKIERLRRQTASMNGSGPIQTKPRVASFAHDIQERAAELALDNISVSCVDTQGQVVHIILSRLEADPLSGATWPELVQVVLQKLGAERVPYFTTDADQPQNDHVHLLLQCRHHDVQ